VVVEALKYKSSMTTWFLAHHHSMVAAVEAQEFLPFKSLH